MGTKILVIDDEADIRAFMTAVLRRNGYETLTASNGEEGIEVARRERPDLITLDLLMPRQSGVDFYRTLGEDENLSGIPVIVISGMSGKDIDARPPAAVFDKPIEPATLVAAVQEVLAR